MQGSGSRVHGITWSISGNSDFYVDFFGDLHTGWQSIIAPGPQTMTVTASASGYTTASTAIDGDGDRHIGSSDNDDYTRSSCDGF
jgi:hypothetical protein